MLFVSREFYFIVPTFHVGLLILNPVGVLIGQPRTGLNDVCFAFYSFIPALHMGLLPLNPVGVLIGQPRTGLNDVCFAFYSFIPALHMGLLPLNPVGVPKGQPRMGLNDVCPASQRGDTKHERRDYKKQLKKNYTQRKNTKRENIFIISQFNSNNNYLDEKYNLFPIFVRYFGRL